MAAIAVTDWTLTVQNEYILNKHRRTGCKLVLSGTKALTYPSSGGIPLPTTLGMRRNISNVILIDVAVAPSVNQAMWLYDKDNHCLRGYWSVGATSTANANPTSFPELPTTWKPSFQSAGQDFVCYVECIGW